MTLTVYFYDARGCSLASPETVTYESPLAAYSHALTLRDAVAKSRGVRVYLHTVEGP